MYERYAAQKAAGEERSSRDERIPALGLPQTSIVQRCMSVCRCLFVGNPDYYGGWQALVLPQTTTVHAGARVTADWYSA